MELARIAKENIDISAAAELFSYDYTGEAPKEVIARVDLGDEDKPIAGAGSYVLQMRLNDTTISPDSRVDVAAGVTRTILVSRHIPISAGDVVAINVTGLPADTGINAVVSLRDATPLRADELTGAGATVVDHNYGGDASLTVMTPQGVRIDGADILAFRGEDYEADRRTAAYVVSRTRTNVNGEWASPMMLDAGDYTLVIFKQGVIQTKVVDLTVA